MTSGGVGLNPPTENSHPDQGGSREKLLTHRWVGASELHKFIKYMILIWWVLLCISGYKQVFLLVWCVIFSINFLKCYIWSSGGRGGWMLEIFWSSSKNVSFFIHLYIDGYLIQIQGRWSPFILVSFVTNVDLKQIQSDWVKECDFVLCQQEHVYGCMWAYKVYARPMETG